MKKLVSAIIFNLSTLILGPLLAMIVCLGILSVVNTELMILDIFTVDYSVSILVFSTLALINYMYSKETILNKNYETSIRNMPIRILLNLFPKSLILPSVIIFAIVVSAYITSSLYSSIYFFLLILSVIIVLFDYLLAS